MTRRIGPGWRPVFDDEKASRIGGEFAAVGLDVTEVTATYTQLSRPARWPGSSSRPSRRPGPGESLERYAATVARHAATLRTG